MRERAVNVGSGFIRASMPDQHRDLFGRLPWLLVGSVDSTGQPHASVVVGPPGFVRSPDAFHLVVAAGPLPGDPLATTLAPGAAVGVLGLEPATRRRNRANGRVVSVEGQVWTFEVEQSFGNCPKHIQPRTLDFDGGNAAKPVARVVQRAEHLDASLARLVEQADTFFVASARPHAGGYDVDISHRGGPTGFVTVHAGTSLRFPDFPGNNFFNTLGNVHLHPRVGLLFVDIASGDRLYITGEAEIFWAGSARELRLAIRQVVHVTGPLPLRWGEAACR